jgi:hypothetical protein
MRLSLEKGARAALSSAAWQEIRVRYGRDDKGGVGAFIKIGHTDAPVRRPLSKAGTFICLQIGIWQGCQISRLFHEDAQGAQAIYLSILPG